MFTNITNSTTTDTSLYDPSLNQTLLLALEGVREYLKEFGASPEFIDKMHLAFGDFQIETALKLAAAWENEDFSLIPSIVFLSKADLNGANGAYAGATNTIYLSKEFVAGNQNNLAAVVNVVLEEFGHRIDTLLNQTDSAGDEGAIFSALVRGYSLDDATLEALKAEDDSGIVTVDGEALAIEQSTNVIRTASGDGELRVTVDEFGGFDSALYDPIGSKTLADTTYSSFIALGIIGTNGTTGARTQLNSSASNNETFTNSNNTITNSTFTVSGLQFQLRQTVQDTLNSTAIRTGSRLDQTYTITNTTTQTINFDIIRYVDGDLAFDGSIADGGGRIVQDGQEILFETDRGGTGQTDTTFFGIAGTGGTIPTTNRWELDGYSSLKSNVLGGNSLRNIIVRGDSDSNQFIDPGAEYDVALALRNVFSLAPGQSTTYTTTTRFGSGEAGQLDVTPPTGGINNLPATTIGNNINVTWGATDPSGIKNYDVFVSVNGAAFTQWLTDVTTTSAVYSGELGKTYTFYSIATDNAGNEQIVTTAPRTSTQIINPITLAVSPTSVTEDGTTNLIYTFTRSGNLTTALTTNFNVGGTATFNTDYSQTGTASFNATTGTVTFAAGASTATVTIDPTPDTTIESNETVTLTLADGAGYTIGTTTAVTGTIVDDDTLTIPGTLSFSAPQFSVREDGTPIAAVTVIRTGGKDGATSATINLKNGTAKAPSDYNNTPITVNFANGEISKTVTIPIVNDTILEPDETLQLILTNPTGGTTIGQQNTATLTIIDKDAPLITGLAQGSSGSNKGQATIVIAGQSFLPTDQISIVDPNGVEKAASKVYWVNAKEAWATFDLQGLATGKYDVKVANGQNSSVSNDTFTVTDGSLGNIQVKLSYPAQGVVTVKYTNIGQTDIVAPLLRITPTNAQVTYPEENTVSATLRQLLNLTLATSDNGPAGILAPGKSGEFSFNYTPNGNGLISFAVEQVKPDEVINWASIKAESRPDYYTSSEAWDVTWSNLTDALGTTTGQFQTVMAENANYLSQLGQETNDLHRLFAFEWQQTANNLSNISLTTITDVVDSAPGLSLTFNRTFYQSIAERYNLGSFGRGWASQWDLRATTDSKGNVVIRSVGDLQRVFEKKTDGTYTEDGGATLTITNGQYRLKEANGIVSLFGTDGKLSYVEDTNANRITLQYTNNNLTKLVHTNGDSLTLAYNAQGRISQITDSTGQITNYSYDASGENLLSVTSPEGTTTYTYDTGNIAAKKYSLLSVKSDLGYQRSFEYDNQGRLIKEFSNGQTQTLNYSYDNTGGVTITDNTGASQTILLDDRGNGGQIRGVNNQNLIFRYDANGNLIGATLPNGSQTGYTYDSKDNLTQQTNLLSQNVKFTYDSTFNQLTGFTDPKGNSVNYTYDTKGNLSKITYPDGSFQQFSLDALGNVTSSINRRGNTIQYTYNTSGQLTKKQYADGSSATYSYDTKENLTSVTDGTGTITMQYDTANRLTNITYPTGRSLSYTYNVDGQRTKLVSQDGYTVNYSYDTVGRLKTLTNATGENIISYDYDSAGRLIKETNGNGTYTTYEYDLQNQLTRLSNYKADNTVNSKFEYAYDNLGRRTSMTTLEGTFQYGYDATGQLTSVVTPTNRTINYQYDAAGNRIGVTDNGTTTNYSTNNLNQYTNVGNAVYTYDKDGNLISKTEGGQTSTYTYDVENRLTKVVAPQGTWDYQYDGLGNRVATILNGQRTEYLLDPLGLRDIIGEYDRNGNLVANYTHGIGLVSRVNGSNSNYYDADAIGSTVGLTANDGSYVNRYSYLPFGEDLTKLEGIANPFEYVGQWGVTNEGNGLDFMRARFYDSGLGRFTAVDPIGFNGGDTNFYRYVSNDPVIYIDPIGFARFYYRPLDGYLGILYPIGRNPLDNYTNTEIGHEQIFYDDGTNEGYFNDGKVRPDNPKNLTNYDPSSASKYYDDDLLRQAVKNVKPDPYFVIPTPWNDNCQSWAERVRDEYERLKNQQPKPPKTPTPGGGTTNDPHLKTLDGLGYDFQAVGEFTLVKSITDDFEIQTRQQPWNTSTSASANAAIAIKSDGQRIALYANQPQKLVINGNATTLPDGALYAVGQNLITRQGNQYSIITANNDLILVNDRGTFLNINLGLADNRKGKVVGLLGNFNNNRNDEFALRNGTAIGATITNQQLYGDYGNSWRITQETSLFDYAAGISTATFTDLAFPRNIVTIDTLTPQQRATAEQIARTAGITDPQVLEDATVDIFLTNGAPEFIQGAISQQRLNVANNPNTLVNPDGFGDEQWLTSGAVIPYTIRFSNNAAQGTTPVAQVTITQQLDTDLDLNTFSLNSFGFGDITINVDTGAKNYSRRLDLRSTKGVFVDVNAGLDASTGVVTWTFTAIDPTTGNAANSTTQGFLPPNDQNGAGRGFVGYSIQPKANLTNRTRIDAQASITFNSQTPIQTTAIFNTLDSDIPTSKVNALAANSNANFTVSWTGSDNGSGIVYYDIYVATDGGQYVLWKDKITDTSATYNGETGKTYAFYSVATDNLGLKQIAPTQADATTTIATIVASNNPPTVKQAIIDQTTTEDTNFTFTIPENTFADIDAGDLLTFSATLENGNPLPSWLTFNPATRTFSGIPTNNNVGSANIKAIVTDKYGASVNDVFNLTVKQNNTLPTFKLEKIADDIFNVTSNSGKLKLQVTLTGRSSNNVNELGVFTVDDAQGNIQGIAPGAVGYTEAALNRANVIFSAIANLPNGFNPNNLTQHLLEFNSGNNLRFYLVKNSSTDAVRAGITPATDVLFSDPLRQKVTDLGADSFSLAWKDGSNSNVDFQDLVVNVKATNDSLPLGTATQGNFQGELIDLRSITGQVQAEFTLNREAAFNNFVGFYKIANVNGGIDIDNNGSVDLQPGDAGYIEAAIRGRIPGIDLTVNNQSTAIFKSTLEGGSLLAPFIIANGTPEAIIDNNPNNNSDVYVPFQVANPGKYDHIRLLGNNTWGFEDLPLGGDKDYNDVVMRANLKLI